MSQQSANASDSEMSLENTKPAGSSSSPVLTLARAPAKQRRPLVSPDVENPWYNLFDQWVDDSPSDEDFEAESEQQSDDLSADIEFPFCRLPHVWNEDGSCPICTPRIATEPPSGGLLTISEFPICYGPHVWNEDGTCHVCSPIISPDNNAEQQPAPPQSDSPPVSTLKWDNAEKVQKGELNPVEPAEDPKFAGTEARPWIQWLKQGLFDGVDAVYDKVDDANQITGVTCTAYVLSDDVNHSPLAEEVEEPIHKTIVTDYM